MVPSPSWDCSAGQGWSWIYTRGKTSKPNPSLLNTGHSIRQTKAGSLSPCPEGHEQEPALGTSPPHRLCGGPRRHQPGAPAQAGGPLSAVFHHEGQRCPGWLSWEQRAGGTLLLLLPDGHQGPHFWRPDALLSCPREAAQEPRALLRAVLPLPGAAWDHVIGAGEMSGRGGLEDCAVSARSGIAAWLFTWIPVTLGKSLNLSGPQGPLP